MASSLPANSNTSLKRWPLTPGWNLMEIGWLALAIGVAIVLRVVALEQIPPGMQHDEVFDARFATLIQDGARPVYFDENFGVPPLFMYLVAFNFSLLGQNLLALRLTSAFIGISGLLVNYLLIRELFGRRVALLTVSFLAISFWHLFDSRVGLEPILIPLLAGAAFYALWRGLRSGNLFWYGIAGLFIGLAPYGYHSGPLVGATVIVFVLYLLVFQRSRSLVKKDQAYLWIRAPLGFLLVLLIAALVITPLVIHIAGHADESLARVQTLSAHTRLLLAGDPRPILGDMLGVLGMFGVRGDPEWRYNVSGRPVFDPVTFVLFLIGLAVSLIRWRRPEYAFLLLWLPINLISAAITPPSPSSLRALGAIVPTYAVAMIGLVTTNDLIVQKWPKQGKMVMIGLITLLLAGNAFWTIRDYFYVWPRHPEVRAIYRADLATAARYLDAVKPTETVLISAEFAADLDQQTFNYMLRHNRPIKWFNARRSFPIPVLEAEQPAIYLFPATDPVTSPILARLEPLSPQKEQLRDLAGDVAVQIFRLTPQQIDQLRRARPERRLDINLGGEMDLLGYDLSESLVAGEPIDLELLWRVQRGGQGHITYAFFAHVLDERGFRWAQDDPVAFPSHSWWAGDLVFQFFSDLKMPADAPPGKYVIDIGAYDQRTGIRLTPNRKEAVINPSAVTLHPITVMPARCPPAPADWQIEDHIKATFGNRLTLLGYFISRRILNLDDRAEVALTWQAEQSAAPDVMIEVILTSENGMRLPIIQRHLVDGHYPLDKWSAGQIIRDRFWLEHTTNIPRAIYDVEVSIRDSDSGEALPLVDGNTSVSIGKVFMRGLKKGNSTG